MMRSKTKVGLISFHNAYNYGAAMQAYALQEALNDINVDAEYINYINNHRKYIYNTPYQIGLALKNKKIVRAIRLLLGSVFISSRARKFKDFYRTHLKTTSRIYINSVDAQSLNGKYDKFIVGSDQVWRKWNFTSLDFFFLSWLKVDVPKLGYAISYGKDEWELTKEVVGRFIDS